MKISIHYQDRPDIVAHKFIKVFEVLGHEVIEEFGNDEKTNIIYNIYVEGEDE